MHESKQQVNNLEICQEARQDMAGLNAVLGKWLSSKVLSSMEEGVQSPRNFDIVLKHFLK